MLDHLQNFRDRKNVPQRDNYPDHTENGEKLEPDDAVCFFQARQTICASHLARKSGEVAGAIEMQKRCNQVDTGKFSTSSSDDSQIGTVSIVKRGIARLDTLGLCVRTTRNTKAVKNYPRGVGAIERVEVNASHIVIQKIVALFQGEMNTYSPDHFRIVRASL